VVTKAVNFPLPNRQRVTAHYDGALATDLPAALNTPWLAVFDGTTRPYFSGTAGNALYLLSADGTTTAYYGHGTDEPDARVLGAVVAGQQIGAVGMTGYTTGPHLHFAVTTDRVVTTAGGGTLDPAAWLDDVAPVIDQPIQPPLLTGPLPPTATPPTATPPTATPPRATPPTATPPIVASLSPSFVLSSSAIAAILGTVVLVALLDD